MDIISKIKQSVEEATGLAFYYDTPQTLNYRLDNVERFPCAMLDIVESGVVEDVNGIIRERLTITVLFAEPSELDFDGIDVESRQLDRLKTYAFSWLVSLRKSHELRLISNNSTRRLYASDDIVMCAYGVNVTIEDIEGVSICTELPKF